MSILSGVGFRFLRAVLSYVMKGGLRLPDGHRPVRGHLVPDDFAGVGVATGADPAIDDYVLARLEELGIRQVRIDYTYGDEEGPPARLLEKLCAHSYQVMLHLVQPLGAAQRMSDADAQKEWGTFVSGTLDRFGARISKVEIGSTVNRKRWAGYTLEGFLSMWDIAYREVRAHGVTLAGPSVTDFEPPFNIGLLALLEDRGQLPDIHTDNLFSERCTEPERFDHKAFGRFLAPLLKVNLIRKARLLHKIAKDFGVSRVLSPAAFWTLPRIERMLPDSDQKQADYLARYMILCAASGALEGAWWGPLICHREGLIDDGVLQYPALERITHYASVTGESSNFRVRPAFHALRAFARLIPGCRYEGRLNDSSALEVHGFSSEFRKIHVVWTINGRAAALTDIYSAENLLGAQGFSRDGDRLEAIPSIIGEAPIYLCWPLGREVKPVFTADILSDVTVHLHATDKQHFHFNEDGWRGVVLAADADEAALLLQKIHPQRIGVPPRESILRHARNAIWKIDDPRCAGHQLVVKQPVKMHLHKRFLDRFKSSKGARSWSGTCELLRRGIDAAAPVAYFEKIGDSSLLQNYYLCEFVPAELSVRELVAAFARGDSLCVGISEQQAWRQLCDFLLGMHGRGICFRDLSGGNILIRASAPGRLEFFLIDTGRLHVFERPLPLNKRISDLVRVCNKMSSEGRDRFMAIYMEGVGGAFGGISRLPFAVYNFKVFLKRRAGRKAIRDLVARFKRKMT